MILNNYVIITVLNCSIKCNAFTIKVSAFFYCEVTDMPDTIESPLFTFFIHSYLPIIDTHIVPPLDAFWKSYFAFLSISAVTANKRASANFAPTESEYLS